MDNKQTQKDIDRSYKIEKQVERWDLFAKIAPTIFLVVCFVMLALGSISFETVFVVGMILFSVTAVIWWFWTIFSIRHLVRTLRRASTGLLDVTGELKEAKKDLRKYLDEENNRR
jgi:ABC-type multidrug transport system fused ATPase/permease subunit